MKNNKFFADKLEPNKTVRILETVLIVVFLVAAVSLLLTGFSEVNRPVESWSEKEMVILTRDLEGEDYDEDSTICDVTYTNGEDTLVIRYGYEDYLLLNTKEITAYVYQSDDGYRLCFEHQNPSLNEINKVHRQSVAEAMMGRFNLAVSLLILAITVTIVLLFSRMFSTYEKIWFVSIMVLASIFAALFPEESANGVNGIVIMILYLLDTFFNILCELLISKQSRYNFLVSLLVEVVEIAICIVLMYRFATMVVTLFFWIPIDIVSFINWSKHKDEQQEELTVVRRLKGYQEVLVLVGIALWTIIVGYLISGLDIVSDFIQSHSLATMVIYLDACASAVGIANGLFIFFRLREQWIAWYLCALLESLINVLTGQYVLLVLKLGYLTNTTYGYIKWSRYIRSRDGK